MSEKLEAKKIGRFLASCRKQRHALIETIATLRAAKEKTNIRDLASAQINATLDARILNCECSIARFDLIIAEAEAKGSG